MTVAPAAAEPHLDADAPPHRHEERVRAGDAEYVVTVGGTVDGESLRDPVGYGNYGQPWENNLWLRLENVGVDAVANPRVRVDGRGPWHSLGDLLDEILEPGMTEAQKARAIWEFARTHRYHCTTGDDEVKDTVKMLNVYGYTLCWDEAYTVSNLWQAAGLRIRRGLPHGHCTTEVYYDGAFHLLDSDEHLLVLERDNETVAGESDLSRDHDLMKRSHAYGILAREDRDTTESAASLFCHDGPRSGSRPAIGDHRMDLTLRPGEAIAWVWAPRGRWRGYGDAPPRYANGCLEWTPPLGAEAARWALGADGVRAAGEATVVGDARVGGAILWRLAAPYALVGGRVALDGAGAPARLELRRGDGAWTVVADDLRGEARVDLDPCFPPAMPASYRCDLRLSGRGVTLRRVGVALDLQMAPLSLPALRVGANRVTYRDDATARDVRITHAWRERSDLVPPAAPVPESPAGGAAVAGTAPTLRWSATAGAGGDYHLRLGATPDLRWVLSPVFEKLVSRTPSRGRAEWTVPQVGLLNPGTQYYWHVRARSAAGLWGPWSATAHFVPRAPGVPLDVALRVDWETRRGRLHWRPNPAGAVPARYEIHGSDERGFSARRQAYAIVAGASDPDGRRPMPANLLFAVDGSQASAEVLGAGVAAGNRAFYRVVAIDADGVRSGPSAYAEAPRPFVCADLPRRVAAGRATAWPLASVRSLGELRAESRGPQRYLKEIRDGDELTWILDEGPEWVELDGATGTLTLRPEAHAAGTHTVTVRVKNGQGGVDVVGFDVEVVP